MNQPFQTISVGNASKNWKDAKRRFELFALLPFNWRTEELTAISKENFLTSIHDQYVLCGLVNTYWHRLFLVELNVPEEGLRIQVEHRVQPKTAGVSEC